MSGGADKRGAFVVQCIAVDDKTVSVVQGIDYSQRKGPLGAFVDEVQAALLKAAKQTDWDPRQRQQRCHTTAGASLRGLACRPNLHASFCD